MNNNFTIEYANIHTILKKYGSDIAPCPFCGGEVIPHHATTILDDGTKVDYGYRFFFVNMVVVCRQSSMIITKKQERLGIQERNGK